MSNYFIRHCQSEFNAAHNDGDKDPMIFDAPLTEKGRRQARDAKALVADLGIKRGIKKPFLYGLPYYPIAGHRRKRVCLNQTKESNHFMQVVECREQAAGHPLA